MLLQLVPFSVVIAYDQLARPAGGPTAPPRSRCPHRSPSFVLLQHQKVQVFWVWRNSHWRGCHGHPAEFRMQSRYPTQFAMCRDSAIPWCHSSLSLDHSAENWYRLVVRPPTSSWSHAPWLDVLSTIVIKQCVCHSVHTLQQQNRVQSLRKNGQQWRHYQAGSSATTNTTLLHAPLMSCLVTASWFCYLWIGRFLTSPAAAHSWRRTWTIADRVGS